MTKNISTWQGKIAKKQFGQNFLQHQGIIEQIIHAISPNPQKPLIEIGPGLGALTSYLYTAQPQLNVIEIDTEMQEFLIKKFPDLTIINQDVLTVDFNKLQQTQQKIQVVGNLPYNISSPLLFHLVNFRDVILDQHFMLQREVIERMVAQPKQDNYGRLSVMMQFYYAMNHLFDVPPEAFDPAPKVWSSVIRMRPLTDTQKPELWKEIDENLFSNVVKEAFSQRRKMLRNTLKAKFEEMICWEDLPFPPTARAEELSVHDFVALTLMIQKK